MPVCDTKTSQKDTLLDILQLYFTNYYIVSTLGINWIKKKLGYIVFEKCASVCDIP